MQDRLPQSRSDAVLQARTGHITVLRELLPYIWPANRPDLRLRVIFALGALVVAKVITLAVPIAYKAIVDALTGNASAGEVAGLSAFGLAAVPAMLIVAYGVGRVLMVVFTQFRDVWFTAVAQHAVRALAKRTFRHLHALSLRFHLERRTGGLNRVIERGVTGVDTIVRMAILNSIPTAVELVMICGLVAYYFGWIYVVVVFLTVAFYVTFTFWASERRI
jgi:ABC-type multidrug transport system fused ATPase/permease subunit